jgi:hypothetical protein
VITINPNDLNEERRRHGERSAKQQGNQEETGDDTEGKEGREEGQEKVMVY